MTKIDPYDLNQRVPEPPFRSLFSRRVGSLRYIFWAVFALLWITVSAFFVPLAISGAEFFNEGKIGEFLVGPILALIAAELAALLKLYDSMDKRLGLVETLLHEMISICRLTVTTDVVKAYSALYFMPGFAIFKDIRGECYTNCYDNNIKELGFLGPNALNNIVNFYTMLKGARERVQYLKIWAILDSKQSEYPSNFIDNYKKYDIVSIIYCLFVAFENAYYVVNELSENQQQKEHYHKFIMTQLCDCYAFLIDVMPLWDDRINWLTNKRRKELFSCERSETYKAREKRYNELKRTLQEDYRNFYYHKLFQKYTIKETKENLRKQIKK